MPAFRPVAPDLAVLRTAFVNLYAVGAPLSGDRGFVLVDTGLPGHARRIREAVERRFGPGARPAAIVLTHGHFDHVGGLPALARAWDAPIAAHPMELPFLTGRSPYPPPDPRVGGGAMAWLSPLYPRGPHDFRPHVGPLPSDGSVPGLPGWRWLATPGHSPGHVSLWREADRVLIAGDAFVTTKQESAVAALTSRVGMHGPPAYFTPDWIAAGASVRVLAGLEPALAATGHGVPLRGPGMLRALRALADDFERRAVPARGRYVGRPAVTGPGGIVSVPPRPAPRALTLLAAAGGAALLGRWLARRPRAA